MKGAAFRWSAYAAAFAAGVVAGAYGLIAAVSSLGSHARPTT